MLRTRKLEMLAKIHGPFARFYPGGVELAPNPLDEEVKTPDDQAAIDKARLADQQLEQERGNARRAIDKANAAQASVDAANAENEKLKELLEAANAKAIEAGIKSVELDEADYEGSDLKIIQSIKALEAKIEAKDQRIAGLEVTVKTAEQKRQAEKAAAETNSAYEELLSDLDKEYGADCRNAAVKAFEILAENGEVSSSRPGKATRALEKCYRDAKAAKAKPVKKDTLDLDAGSGGGISPNLKGISVQEGSLEDVAKQYGKAIKAAAP